VAPLTIENVFDIPLKNENAEASTLKSATMQDKNNAFLWFREAYILRSLYKNNI
jgi:hypothetical protein